MHFRVFTLDDLTKGFGNAKSTGPGRTGPSAGQELMAPTDRPFTGTVEYDPRRKSKKPKDKLYLPLDLPGSGISKAEGYVKPHTRTRKGKMEHVTGHRRKLPLMEAMVWQVAKDHGLSRNQADVMVRGSLTLNDPFTGIKHELVPDSLVIRVDLPNGTSLIKEHKTFDEARKTLDSLRELQKLAKPEWDKYSQAGMESIRLGYAGALKRKFGFEDEKKLSAPEHVVFRTGLPEGFDPNEFSIPEHTVRGGLIGITDVGKDGKYRVSLYLGKRSLFTKEGFADRDKAKEGLSKLMAKLQQKDKTDVVAQAEKLYVEGKRGSLPPRSLVEKEVAKAVYKIAKNVRLAKMEGANEQEAKKNEE